MKRVLSLFLAFVMILGLMPITALPARTVASTDAVGSEELVDAVGSYKRLEALMERGSVTYTYDFGYSTEFYNNYVRTAYDIKPGGAGRIAIEQLPATHETVYIQFFASDYTKISSVSYTEGSNMVYLLVDGVEIGALDNYFVGGNPRNSKGSWLNGMDFVFSYIGSTSHPLTRYALEYLSITECVHSFQSGVCIHCGAEDPNPYAGKTIACIGDSITYGVGVTRDETDYVKLLAEALEMNYIRLGASGTTLCTGGHAKCNIDKLTEANLSGADVVTILMGINDFVQARNGYYKLGTIDSTDTSAIYGAVHMWCQRIVELRQTEALQDTEFYFMTPVITSWNNSVTTTRNWDQSKTNVYGYTLRDLCNAIIEVCALYDIPVIDLNLLSGLYYNSAEDNTVAEFGGDGAHPGVTGHRMMAEAIANRLLQNHLRDDHDHSYGSWITTTYPHCHGGQQQRVCSLCTATESRSLDPIDHAYEKGICTICGNVLGDLDLNGDVDAQDLTILARHVAGIERLASANTLSNADVNGDGSIDASDLTMHARYVAGIITSWQEETSQSKTE